MSAFIVDKKHIDAMITMYRQMQWDYGYSATCSEENLNERGQLLLNENYKSVNVRYETQDKPYEYKFEVLKKSPVEIIKACQCYDYQACETEDYEESRAHQLCKIIMNHSISQLEGYNEAKWEITE